MGNHPSIIEHKAMWLWTANSKKAGLTSSIAPGSAGICWASEMYAFHNSDHRQSGTGKNLAVRHIIIIINTPNCCTCERSVVSVQLISDCLLVS